MVKQRCMHIASDLVEERFRGVAIRGIGSAQDRLRFGQQDVGIPEDRHVIALVATIG